MHRTTATRVARLATVALATLAFVATAVVPAAAASPSAEAKAKAEHDRIVKYWTAERIANAKPRDFEKTADGSITIKAKPVKPPPGGGGGGTVTGASWTGNGPVVSRTGKVLFTMGGGQWVCSAAVIQEPGQGRSTHSLVLTAAHCAYDEAADVFATNWIFVPSFDTSPTFTCAQATIGCWTATSLVVHQGWVQEESLTTEATEHDFAVAVVAGGGKTGTTTQLDSAVGGGFAVNTAVITVGTRVNSFGYPAAGRYRGNDLTYCAGPVFGDSLAGNRTWGIACNMTGGSSGGPWIKDFAGNGASGSVTSLNSYGYGGISNMYGPKFNAKTQAVINAANGATLTNVVVP